MKLAVLLAIISLAATAAGGAIALEANTADLPKGIPTSLEVMWWTFAGVNAGLMASTVLAYHRISNGTVKHKAVATVSAIMLTITAGIWGFMATEAAR